jgi:hypothetical protein
MIDWLWNHGRSMFHWNWAVIAALSASVFAGWQAILTRRLVRLQQIPLVTLNALGKGEDAPCAVSNIGPCPALSVFLFREGYEGPVFKTLLGVRSIGDLFTKESRTLDTPITVKLVEEHAYYLYYRDTGLRWYATRIARRGYGLATEPLGRRWLVPKDIREQVVAKTVVEEFVQRTKWIRFWRLFSSGSRRNRKLR